MVKSTLPFGRRNTPRNTRWSRTTWRRTNTKRKQDLTKHLEFLPSHLSFMRAATNNLVFYIVIHTDETNGRFRRGTHSNWFRLPTQHTHVSMKHWRQGEGKVGATLRNERKRRATQNSIYAKADPVYHSDESFRFSSLLCALLRPP